MKKSIKETQLHSISWYKRLKIYTWLTILGGFIIFWSWIVQNHYKAKWDDKIQMLQRTQLVVDIEEVHRSFWERAFMGSFITYNVHL